MVDNRTLLLQLREAAKSERDELIRFNMKLAADQLSEAIDRFADDPTADNLTTVNGRWAHCLRVLSYAGKGGVPGGTGAGLKEGALLAEAA